MRGFMFLAEHDENYNTVLFEVSFLSADSSRNFTLLQLLITLMKSKELVNSKMKNEMRT